MKNETDNQIMCHRVAAVRALERELERLATEKESILRYIGCGYRMDKSTELLARNREKVYEQLAEMCKESPEDAE